LKCLRMSLTFRSNISVQSVCVIDRPKRRALLQSAYVSSRFVFQFRSEFFRPNAASREMEKHLTISDRHKSTSPPGSTRRIRDFRHKGNPPAFRRRPKRSRDPDRDTCDSRRRDMAADLSNVRAIGRIFHRQTRCDTRGPSRRDALPAITVPTDACGCNRSGSSHPVRRSSAAGRRRLRGTPQVRDSVVGFRR
jgi:hypothetical protein